MLRYLSIKFGFTTAHYWIGLTITPFNWAFGKTRSSIAPDETKMVGQRIGPIQLTVVRSNTPKHGVYPANDSLPTD